LFKLEKNSAVVFWFVVAIGVVSGQPVQDTASVNRLNRTVTAIRETHIDSALALSQRAAHLATELNYPSGLAKALENTGWMEYRKGNFGQSMEASYRALTLATDLNDSLQLAHLHNNMGAIYFAQSQFQLALMEFRKGHALALASRDLPVLARSTNNMAFMYASLKKYDSAEYYARRTLALAEQLNDPYLSSFAYRNLGDALLATDRTEQAYLVYQRALGGAMERNLVSVQVAIQPRIARLYLKRGKYAEAYPLLTSTIELAKKHGYKDELLVSYRLLADWLRANKRFAEASDVLDQYVVLSDSVRAMKWSNQMASLQAQFELDMKEAQIDLLTKEQELSRTTISRQRILLWAVSLGLTAIVAAGLIFWYTTRKIRQANRTIKAHQNELKERNREVEEQRAKLEHLNATKDKIFSIIGHDLRSPLQSLNGLLALIGQNSLTPQEFAHYSKDLKGRIDIVYDNLDNLLHWSVGQINGIKTNPRPIATGNIFKEVTGLYCEVADRKQVSMQILQAAETSVVADGDHLRLVLRNLVSNALKFSNTGGTVVLGAGEPKNGHVSVFVSDNGTGIDPDNLNRLFSKENRWTQRGTQQEKGLGIGLLLCQEFLEKNGSQLEVTSRPGQGSTFSFSLPVATGETAATKPSADPIL